MKKANFKKTYKQKESKHKEEWQEKAEELTNYFNKNCYPIFYKIQRAYIDEAFRVCKEKKIRNIKYFWGVIKKRKEQAQTYKEYNRPKVWEKSFEEHQENQSNI
jgi:hypothetical protein